MKNKNSKLSESEVKVAGLVGGDSKVTTPSEEKQVVEKPVVPSPVVAKPDLTRGYSKFLVGRGEDKNDPRVKIEKFAKVELIEDVVGPTGNKLLFVQCAGVSFKLPVDEAMLRLQK